MFLSVKFKCKFVASLILFILQYSFVQIVSATDANDLQKVRKISVLALYLYKVVCLFENSRLKKYIVYITKTKSYKF